MGELTASGSRPFRFGVVAPITGDLTTWRDQVRRIADSGYSTLLMPDVAHWQPAPAPTLATAAASTNLRVGTWVYASPLRPAWITAWEAHTMSVLTDGRFEMGIGTGRPGIEQELSELGLPVTRPAQRLAQVRETVTTLREVDGADLHTPVVMAVRGPKAQALAVDLADSVTFALRPDETRADVTKLASDFGATRDIELALHVPVVGGAVAPFMAPPDTNPEDLRAVDSLAILPSDPSAGCRGDLPAPRGDRLFLLRRRRRRRRRARTRRGPAHRTLGKSRSPLQSAPCAGQLGDSLRHPIDLQLTRAPFPPPGDPTSHHLLF